MLRKPYSQINNYYQGDAELIFSVYKTAITEDVQISETPIVVCNAQQYNLNNAYNVANGLFTVPVSGFYKLDTSIILQDFTVSTPLNIDAELRTTEPSSVLQKWFTKFEDAIVLSLDLDTVVYFYSTKTYHISLSGADCLVSIIGFSLPLLTTNISLVKLKEVSPI